MARPKLGESNAVRLNIFITADEVSAIEAWQHANGVINKSEAVRQLCRQGISVSALPRLPKHFRARANAALHGFPYPPTDEALILRGLELALSELENLALAAVSDGILTEPTPTLSPEINREMLELIKRPTASIPEVGRVFLGLARNAAYEAAKRGDIPIITVGGKKRVVMRELCKKLGIKTAFTD